MDTHNILKQIDGQVKKDVDTIKEQIEQFINEAKKEQDLTLEIELLESYVKLLGRKNAFKGPEEIFRSITIAGNIDSELDIINDSLTFYLSQNQANNSSYTQPASIMKLQGFIGNLKSKIKKISARMWQFLSQMMNLSDWSVAGNCNLNICGFTGGVTLQLNFKS